MAKLYFRYGAMNSGKSTHLMQVAHNYEERDKKVTVLKPLVDKKGDNFLCSRVGIQRKVDYLIQNSKELREYLKKLKQEDVSCILVDESQFLTTEEVDELFEATKKYNIPIICYGLKIDFRTQVFPGSLRLFELADELEELVTICSCGKKAKFNARIIDGKYVSEGSQVAIDGLDARYDSLCGRCYLEKVLNIDLDN